MPDSAPIVRQLGLVDYEPTWRAMQRYTDERSGESADEIWFLEHHPIFTLGSNANPDHVLMARDIPVLPIDRGGEVTYHGPGQLVVYPLIELQRYGLGVKSLVALLENAMVATLAEFDIIAAAKADAPGVYVDDKKIGSLGLRIRKGCSFHGLALNIDMDLEPFQRINPCGYAGLEMTQVTDYVPDIDFKKVASVLQEKLLQLLNEQ